MQHVVDPFISCPYNPQHRVPQSRIQGHIVKCEKNYPNYAICPYNASHRYPNDKIKAHVKVCPSKEQLLLSSKPSNTTAAITKPEPVVTMEYLNEGDSDYESWD